MMKRVTKEVFIERARAAHGDTYDYSEVVFKNNRVKVNIICPIHGVFSQEPKNHANGNGCPSCGGVARRTLSDFIRDAKTIHGKYTYERAVFKNNRTPVIITCPEHGDFTQIAGDHLSGKGCKACAHGMIDQDEFIKQANLVHGKLYDYSKTIYVRKQTNVTIICPIHGPFSQSPHNHLAGKGCSECKGGVSFNDADFVKNSNELHGGKYDYSLVKYINAHKPVTIICPEHGPFEQKPVVHYNHGCGCSKCNLSNVSKAENDLFDLLDQPNLIRNTRSIIPPSELDGYYSHQNLAIEYCGLYWHGELQGKTRNYHRDKMQRCHEAGIKLITVFEDEWINRPSVVINRLKHALNVSDNSVYARQCDVREISLQEAKNFLDTYHLQGYSGSRYRYGLFYNNVLISVMTFSLPSRAKGQKNETKNTYEISRWASSTNVVGGGSKLLSAFERAVCPEQIFTYADLRWGDGAGYLSMGFTHVHDSKPNYWYFKNKKRIHRFSLRKSPNDNQSLTEWENRQLDGWDRIWDCGHRKFVKTYE